ncbi:MAG TPA: tRNA (guanosine(37)-N1)-methyltransferase TrmD, partial [Oscillospiraceae bacterium]|nr:tRNA (guanosine(37)-N1)-methyltransferase TrmD [Oscillospiraceae bacterium]
MRIDVATLFPEMCERILDESIIGRARKKGAIAVNCHNIRDYSYDKHRRVDDTPYGGGMGMVMQCDPIYNCFKTVTEGREKPYVIYMSPKGKVLNQSKSIELSEKEDIFIICGHYEGVDQRIIDKIVDEEISIGDYVLTG